ncbi:MAG: transposase [Sediminibacterium sp.]|nr:transposase [Sediminibacterium sp.]
MNEGTVCNCWKPYFSTYPNNEHALCSAHIIRELRAVIENDKNLWASEMLEFLLSLYTRTDKGLNTVNNKSYYQKNTKQYAKKVINMK